MTEEQFDEWWASSITREAIASIRQIHRRRLADLMGIASQTDVLSGDRLALETMRARGYLDALDDLSDGESLKEMLSDAGGAG